MTPWASVEDDLEFAEHDKYSFQAGQAKVSEDWSPLLELNLRNVITMRLGRDWATSLCSVFKVTVFSHARTAVLWAHDSVDLPVFHSLIHAVSFESPECLVKADSCGCGTEESRAVKGASWVHGICMQVLTVWDITFTFFAKTYCPRKWSFEVPRSERRGCYVGFRS